MPQSARWKPTIRALALGMFDAIDAHPWVGSALAQAPGEMPIVRILERLGQQVRALSVEDGTQWAVVGTLLNYILGVGGRNAANLQASAIVSCAYQMAEPSTAMGMAFIGARFSNDHSPPAYRLWERSRSARHTSFSCRRNRLNRLNFSDFPPI
jgi:hypothetical protein